jgi:flagellum-specific ATP synthase
MSQQIERWFGRVAKVDGSRIIASLQQARIGDTVSVISKDGEVGGEVVGLDGDVVTILPYDSLQGVAMHDRVVIEPSSYAIYPCADWCGRVINSMCEPLDGLGVLPKGDKKYPLRNLPIPGIERARITECMEVGVRAIDAFVPCCKGQRVGVFAGSGVGKSKLMSQLTKYAKYDVIVIGLVGERGREVREFQEDIVGADSTKSVMIVETSDSSALRRRQAGYTTLAVAEYFRDQGLDVLCIMDSVTRFAFAHREIGLIAGEPPTCKGYPATIHSELARLLERAGPGRENSGMITGVFTVLMEGDDLLDPVVDIVRSIIDGHIVLDRMLADRGHFPAIHPLKSISRTTDVALDAKEHEIMQKAKRLLSLYWDVEELVKLGGYKPGGDPEVDRAVRLFPRFESFLQQGPEKCGRKACFELLENIVNDV